MNNSKEKNKDHLSLFTRLDKDAKGSFTTILILAIVYKNKKTWGYQIKQELNEYLNLENKIKDSTLYTTLNSLEIQYNLLISYNEDRRRYFELSEDGNEIIDSIFNYWNEFAEKSLTLLAKIKDKTK